jgi:hypothetical protein
MDQITIKTPNPEVRFKISGFSLVGLKMAAVGIKLTIKKQTEIDERMNANGEVAPRISSIWN